MEVKVAAGVTYITGVGGITDITRVTVGDTDDVVITDITDDGAVVGGATDVVGVMDVTGVTDVTDIMGGTVRHMAYKWFQMPHFKM